MFKVAFFLRLSILTYQLPTYTSFLETSAGKLYCYFNSNGYSSIRSSLFLFLLVESTSNKLLFLYLACIWCCQMDKESRNIKTEDGWKNLRGSPVCVSTSNGKGKSVDVVGVSFILRLY